MPVIVILRGDITHENVEAIVNAANSGLAGGGGVDGAIHRAAGAAELHAACDEVRSRIGGSLPTGGAVITPGFRLAAKHVIHVVGPRWRGGAKGEAEQLASAYRESMARAKEAGVKTISFPSISTGIYGYPVEQAAPIALKTVWEHLPSLGADAEARFVLFDAVTLQAYLDAATAVLPKDAWRKG